MQKLLLLILISTFLFSCASKEETKCKEGEGINSCKFLKEWSESGLNMKDFIERRWKKNVYKKLEDCSEKTNESKEEKENRVSMCEE